jgi:hypothetical protein
MARMSQRQLPVWCDLILEIVNLHGWQWRGVGAARQLFPEQHVERQNVFKEGKKEAVAERE